MAEIPRTHFVQSGDADLAYQVLVPGGHGRDSRLAVSPGVMWELPEFAAFLDRLASFRRVITFDKRGTGMSDRVPIRQVLSAVAQPGHRRRFIAALEQGRAQVVAEVQRLDRSEVVLAGGRRLRPGAVTCATGYRRGLEPLVGHLADRPAFPGRGIGYRQHWN